MKSKTSSFNTTIFKKNLTHHWPIWIVYLCYLIVVVRSVSGFMQIMRVIISETFRLHRNNIM